MPRPSPAIVEAGAELFAAHCLQCHCFTGGVLDVRSMSQRTHEEFRAIVSLGSHPSRGMRGFADLPSEDEIRFIHGYLIELKYQRLEQSR